jgi:putative spermidine/putrescine transport system permease protein
MVESRLTRVLLRVGSGLTLAFIYLPLVLIAVYAFNKSVTQSWPIDSFTTKWFSTAYHDDGVRQALWLSVRAALGATAVALVLGTLASLAVSRFSFFGRDAISLVVILPLALPGIISGLALRTSYTTVGIDFGLLTIIIGHATFCIVVVYNNAQARLRRVSGSLEQASADLGADSWQTFRYVTFPQLRTAMIAAGLLAFALSFDEVIVTTFTAGDSETLPLWILNNLSRPNQLPIVNVVGLLVILLSIIPVWLAQRLSSDVAVTPGGAR